ncbi:alpha/beta hydrolase family protein [Aeromonas veronii]|uniref:alpha/beta hydrolase family protein n=1 Tax=Aeromonas veronii TaxID=654 RepID=UPI0004144770|nr:dienelactone hydrolase [Aeromonas veronii]QMS76057.1 dienelactone hydrolase [Aeromonas veronii Hm21]
MGLLFRHLLRYVICFGCVFSASVQSANYAGFQRLVVSDPVGKKPMEAVYFYPSVVAEKTLSNIGPYQVAAKQAEKIVPGRYPVIVVSHGNSGSLWSHHDLATLLARQGNIVITLSHPGDNYKDQSGAGATSTWYGRPLQISAAITAAMKNPDISSYIDEDKIAFIGFSAGGATGLFLRGGAIEAARYASYCETYQTQAICLTQGKITNDRPDLSPLPDTRVKAWIFMAPVSMAFSPDSLRMFTAPTLIFTGDKDEELAWENNAGALATTLSSKNKLKVIHNAGHFVFLSPCSSQLRGIAPFLCEDAPGVDRESIHQMVNSEITKFLNSVWLQTSEK